jgi:hypothetical protein
VKESFGPNRRQTARLGRASQAARPKPHPAHGAKSHKQTLSPSLYSVCASVNTIRRRTLGLKLSGPFGTERNSELNSMKMQQLAWLKKSLVHPARMAIAAALALLVAQVLDLSDVLIERIP